MQSSKLVTTLKPKNVTEAPLHIYFSINDITLFAQVTDKCAKSLIAQLTSLGVFNRNIQNSNSLSLS